MAAPENFREYIESILPAQLSGPYAEKLYGMLAGLTGDLHADILRRIIRMPLLRDPESPDDILPYIAADRRLPKYPRESNDEWRARQADAWNIYANAGSNTRLNEQLTAAKFPGAVVHFDITREGPNGESPPYKTQFWIRMPAGSHYVTFGEAMTDEDYETVRFIAFKFSSVFYVPRGIILEFSAETLTSGFRGDSWRGSGFRGDDSTTSIELAF